MCLILHAKHVCNIEYTTFCLEAQNYRCGYGLLLCGNFVNGYYLLHNTPPTKSNLVII